MSQTFLQVFQIQQNQFQTNNLKKQTMLINKPMNRTFNIEDMETYFKNYVPCNYHKKQPITNFCTDMLCSKYLCPQCVEEHSRIHANHRVESIKTSITRTKTRLQDTITILENQTRKNDFLSPENHEQLTKKLINEMEEVKKSLIQQIQLYFKQKQAQVRRQTSKYTQTQITLQTLKKQLNQATKQLKSLKRGLFEPSKTVEVIEKTNRIDYNAMVDHFRKKIKKIEKQLRINIKLEMDPKNRQQFRMALNQLIGVRGKQPIPKKMKKKQQFHDSLLHSARNSTKHHPQLDIPISPKKQYITIPQPLSVDRQMTKNSFPISYPNYFKSGQPFLHFFEVSKGNLHVMKITDLEGNNSGEWDVIELNIGFSIPAFHRTIANQEGVIYLIGGTDQNTMHKSGIIYEFYPSTRTLKPVSTLKSPRSSHSITCFNSLIYISGGMGDSDVLNSFQVFNPITKTTYDLKPCKYATVNSCLATILHDNLLKLGGIFANGQNNDHIEVFNITTGQWVEIDPVIEGVKEDFALLSCCGWAPLTQNQIFIFGGYNEEVDNQSSNSSYVIEYNQQDKQYVIKNINRKKIPIEEGFWSAQSIIHDNIIYALQNVNQGDDGECIEDKRNILIFDGRYWKTAYGNN